MGHVELAGKIKGKEISVCDDFINLKRICAGKDELWAVPFHQE